jgi:hypothetical protein
MVRSPKHRVRGGTVRRRRADDEEVPMEPDRMKNVGNHYNIPPQPPVSEDTTFLDAGSIKIGFEYRELDAESFLATYAGTEFETAARAQLVDDLDLSGVSLHVYDADRDFEYLRFDCFEGDSHYHYIHEWSTSEDVDNHVVQWDEVANGPMLPWALTRIRTRLPEMLVQAGADDLATRIDVERVADATTEVEALIAQLTQRTGAPAS